MALLNNNKSVTPHGAVSINSIILLIRKKIINDPDYINHVNVV